MKHILNEMSDEEKNSIRSQHTGSLQVQTERFKSLVENKLGNAKPLISEDFDNIDYGRTKNGLGPVDDYDFDNIDYGRTKNGLGPDNEELEEDMIDDEDFDDEDEDFDDEDFDDEDSSYNSIENMINDALSNLSSEEGEELLERISELVEGLKSNDEDEEDDESDDDEDMMDLGISESYDEDIW